MLCNLRVTWASEEREEATEDDKYGNESGTDPSLRTADVFPVVPPTRNMSTVRRLY